MIPAFLAVYTLQETLLLVGVIHWFGCIWKMLLFREGINWKLIFVFGFPAALASFLGAYLTIIIPSEPLLRIIGVILIGYVILLYIRPCCELHEGTYTAVVGGASYGFMAGLIGIGGEIRSAFLSSFNLRKAAYIATTGGVSLIVDSVRIATYTSSGITINQDFISKIVLLIIISLIGSVAAWKIVNKIPQEHYRSVVAGFLFIAGIRLSIMP